MKIPTNQALADRADRSDELVAAGYQTEMIFRAGQKALSLRASKMWHLLVKKAGVYMAYDQVHTMPLAELYESGIGHMTHEERIATLRELQTTLVEIRVPSPEVDGRMRVISGPLLSHVERDEDDRGDLLFEFSRTMRRIFADSPHWAVLSKRAVMSFQSRYALRLFEIISLRVNLAHKTSEKFTLEDLRARLGVPPNKLARWQDFKAYALKPAIAEVNQHAGFTVRYAHAKQGRTVFAVVLSWEKKPGQAHKASNPKLDTSKAGGIPQSKGVAGKAVDGESAPMIEFPAGSIRFTAFEAIAKANLPEPMRDIDQVAEVFRAAAKRGRKPLRGEIVTELFAAFCRKQKPV